LSFVYSPAASFWSFVFSEQWINYDCVRVVAGSTLSRLLFDLTSLINDGLLTAIQTVDYDVIDRQVRVLFF
jgi:hypothetical protein